VQCRLRWVDPERAEDGICIDGPDEGDTAVILEDGRMLQDP
jgi:hypothetical protein